MPIRPAAITLDSGTILLTKVQWTDRWCPPQGGSECVAQEAGTELFVMSFGDLTQPTARDLVLFCFAQVARPAIYLEDEDAGTVYRCQQYVSLGGGEAVVIFEVPPTSSRYFFVSFGKRVSIRKP